MHFFSNTLSELNLLQRIILYNCFPVCPGAPVTAGSEVQRDRLRGAASKPHGKQKPSGHLGFVTFPPPSILERPLEDAH